MDSGLMKLLAITMASGAAGSAAGALVCWLSRDAKTRLDYALAIGFVIGAALGAFFGVFESIIGRI